VFFLGSWNRWEFEHARHTGVFGLCENRIEKKREYVERKDKDLFGLGFYSG
jgi:hypothetical protein